jgi:hypothetical protein
MNSTSLFRIHPILGLRFRNKISHHWFSIAANLQQTTTIILTSQLKLNIYQ